MDYLFWEIASLISGMAIVYTAVKGLRMSDQDFIADRERWVRRHFETPELASKKMQEFVDPMRDNPGSWRIMTSGRALAVGITLLLIFVILTSYDIATMR